jgi:hypothetical protein
VNLAYIGTKLDAQAARPVESVGKRMGKVLSSMVIGLLVAACTQTPRANLPGESPPPTQSPPPPTVALVQPTPLPRTQAPAPPTATPRRAFKIGEPVAFQDGWRLTVLKIQDDPPERFFTPKPGTHNVSVFVRHDNGSTVPVSYNPFFFKLQDSSGVRRTTTFASRDDRLGSGEVAPGAFVVGSLTFEVTLGDKMLQLIYEQFGYAQTTFELY